jgi:YVTN family beta-propeller protein
MSDLHEPERPTNPELDAMLWRVLGSARLTSAERERHRARLMTSRKWRAQPITPEHSPWLDLDADESRPRSPVLVHPPSEPGHSRRARSWAREIGKLAAAALAFIIVGTLLILTLRGNVEDQPGTSPPVPTATFVPEATVTPRWVTPVARIDVGLNPYAIAAGAGAVWVPNNGDGTLMRVDPATNQVVATLQIGASPSGIPGTLTSDLFPSMTAAASDTAVWVSRVVATDDSVASAVLEIDPTTNTIAREISLPAQPTSLALDDETLWITAKAHDTLIRLDTRTGQIVATVAIAQPEFLAVGEGAVWVTSAGSNAIVRIDPDTNQISATILVDAAPLSLAVGAGAVWTTTRDSRSLSGALVRIDADALQISASISLLNPSYLTFGAGAVWVVRGGAGVVRLDPATNQAAAVVTISCEPGTLTASQEAIWAVDYCSKRLVRIDPAS